MKRKVNYVELSQTFQQNLKSENSQFEHDEIKVQKVGLQFMAKFNVWQKKGQKLVINTTITKNSLENLENSIIIFLS